MKLLSIESNNEFKEAVFRHRYHTGVRHVLIDEENCPICRSDGVVIVTNKEIMDEESVKPTPVVEGEEG